MNLSQCICTKLTAGILAAVTMVTPAFAATGTVNADGGLRMRTAANTDSYVITTIPDGTDVEVISVAENGWFQVSYLDTMGYVAGDYLMLTDAGAAPASETAVQGTYGRVTEGPLNVRSAPSTQGERVKCLYTGAVVEIKEELDGWYAIDGGYICADYVQRLTAEEAAKLGIGSEVVNYAMQFLGYPYVYGGTTPRGFDCSGFVKYVYEHFGVTMNRTASWQMDNGTPVGMNELVPGDVVFFKKPGSSASRASHVGIYIGGGQFIHASTSTTGVIISDLDYAYYTTGFVGARRLV